VSDTKQEPYRLDNADPIGDHGREWELGILRLRNLIGQQEMLVEGAKREMSLGAWTHNWTQPHAELQGMIDDLITELRRAKGENAALKPQSNADEFASIPLRAWVIEVFQHLCDIPHTPDSWKRDLDEKTQVLLDAIEQGKEVQP
jgi:hypothetical protein